VYLGRSLWLSPFIYSFIHYNHLATFKLLFCCSSVALFVCLHHCEKKKHSQLVLLWSFSLAVSPSLYTGFPLFFLNIFCCWLLLCNLIGSFYCWTLESKHAKAVKQLSERKENKVQLEKRKGFRVEIP